MNGCVVALTLLLPIDGSIQLVEVPVERRLIASIERKDGLDASVLHLRGKKTFVAIGTPDAIKKKPCTPAHGS